ncbi:hypothetical protein [Streptomyces resistomycificus]|uniref:Transferase n=1 Tax=Streptomyces resistomycificus TaxID=67356 RepID=A0A0L8LZD2_9ACTN|nr:hypothetical protein [Streptomyces resistomycificus]KOG43444.1 hypothetical protein ADK37_01510 [Streptomyces resistomycificus]KUN91494.1 hypothetical protein AQJ84_36105 [Streptomyces resistomycificus]
MTMPAPRVAPLRADCVADSAGGLTFDVTANGACDVAHLVLRRSDGHDEVSLPLTPATDGRLRAALPSTVALPEGRWDAYACVAGDEPRRLVPGTTDLRSLAARAPSGSRGHVAVRIPYATRQGNLTVRSWLRAPHAEARELRAGSAGLTVRGRVYGTGLAPEAYAELRRRSLPGPVRRTEVTADQAEFGLAVSYAVLEPGVWDLWLRPGGEAGPRVRIARLLDDVADKKPVFTYPRTRVQTPDGPVEAGPYYTRDNDLSVSVTREGS